MNLRHTIIAVLGLAAASGLLDGYALAHGVMTPRPLDLLLTLTTVIVGYLWYRRDSLEKRCTGSVFMGGSIIVIAIVAIPYYLFRSRAAGRRGRAVGRFAGLVLLYILALGLASMAMGTLVGG